MAHSSGIFVAGIFGAMAYLSVARPAVPPSGVQAAGREVVAAAPTAFVGVAVIPMDSERVLPDQVVLVDKGRITALGSASSVRVPANAVRIDGRGKFLMPGLGDCHVHLGGTPRDPVWLGRFDHGLPPDSLAASRLAGWLADGITTVRNMDYMDRDGVWWQVGGAEAVRLRARAAKGQLWGPRIYTAGQWAPRQYTNYPAHFGNGVDTVPLPALNMDSIPAYVAAYKAAGYDFLKVHEETPAVFVAVLAAARRVGIPVVGHVPEGSLEQALAGKMHSIEHMTAYPGDGVSDKDAQAIAAEARAADTWNCVTMQAGGSGHVKMIRALKDAGAGLLLGTDFPLGGTIQRELELMVKTVGLTPFEAFTAGTKNLALSLGTSGDAGTVAVGKRADLVLLEANPLEDVANFSRRVGVMIGGRWLTQDQLDRRLLAFPQHWLTSELARANIALSGNILDASDSLAVAKPKTSEYERQLRRLVAALGDMSVLMTPDQHAAFDPVARTWLGEQARLGYDLTIAGVTPAP